MGNRNILQDFPSYMLSKEAPDIDEILNNYDDLKKKVQVLQNITTGVFQYQGSRSLKVLVDDIKAYLANGGDNKYSKGCFYNINDLTGFDIKGLTVGDNIVFTGTIVTYSDEIPVSYNSQTGMGNICGFEFDRFPSVVDLSEYLKTADADAKYALISDLNNIVTEMENSIIQGGNIDSLTLDIPFTDTSRINKIYNVVRGNWNRVREEAGGYHRFNYNCTMTNAKIINDNGSYYIQCNASDIPSELYYRQYGIFTLSNELSTFDIAVDRYIYTFEYTSYSGDPPSEVLKFSLKNVQYGPDFSDDYYAQKFVDNIYDLGDIATVWAVDINVGDNFVITKNGFDSMIGNYATSGELNDLQRKLDTINKTLSGVYKNSGDVTEMTLDIPVSSNKINTTYNVKSGFDSSSGYGEHGAFKYKITIKNAYILKTTSDSGNTYELCFKLGDIPSELWYYSIGMLTFYGKFRNTIDYQPTGTSGCFEFTSPSELSIQMSQEGLEYIVKLPYEVSYNAPPIDYYFSDKTFTDNKYQLGNITTIWYRNDIKADDNFVITEHGYDLLSYKLTDYVSKSNFNTLSSKVDKKVDKADGKGLSANDFTDELKNKLDGIESGAQKNTVVSVAGKTGAIVLEKSDIGLGNVDNTADMDKPISAAVQAALALKADKFTITTSTDTALSFEFATNYNTEIRSNELTSISFTFGNGEYAQDYISGLSFDSGETPTAIDYTDSGILNWVGTDCTIYDGLSIFQPSENTHYDIVLYFNGTQFIGLVNGFVSSTGNEAV